MAMLKPPLPERSDCGHAASLALPSAALQLQKTALLTLSLCPLVLRYRRVLHAQCPPTFPNGGHNLLPPQSWNIFTSPDYSLEMN